MYVLQSMQLFVQFKKAGVKLYPFSNIMNNHIKVQEINVENASSEDQKHLTSLGVLQWVFSKRANKMSLYGHIVA